MHYGAGSTPPGASRTSSRGGGGNLKSPDRGQRNGGADVRGGSRGRGGGLSSPRGKRGDATKNATAVSKLGPAAANLLNEIRSAKSRNQWTIHDIQGEFFYSSCYTDVSLYKNISFHTYILHLFDQGTSLSFASIKTDHGLSSRG